MINYFAYGSNISSTRMNQRGINFTNRQFIQLHNYKLVFNKKAMKGNYSYANITPSNGDTIEGYIYKIPENELKILDKFEGYPNHYQRIFLDEINAITYVANSNKIVEGLNPTKEYLDYILTGEDFSKEYLEKLLETKTI